MDEKNSVEKNSAEDISAENISPEDNWVIPVPAEAPQYAMVPWTLYARLLAISEAYAREHGEAPETVTLKRSAQVPAAIVERRKVTRSALDWTPNEADLEGFNDVLSREQMPFNALDRLLDGDHPVKVFRKLRGLTQKKLAEMTGLNATYLSQIETRNRGGSTRVYRRLAVALSVDIGDLID